MINKKGPLKKILFMTSTFKTGKGGVASYAHDFIQKFKNSYNIIVLTSEDVDNERSSDIAIVKFNLCDFSITNAKKALKLIEDYKPDIIFNSNAPLCALISPFIDNNIKLISVSHYVNSKLAWNAGLNGQYLDSVISLSTYGKNYLTNKFNINPSNIHVIYNYMNKSREEVNQEKLNKLPLKIVFPGGCSFHKSAEVVAFAINKLLHTDLKFELYWLGSIKIPGSRLKFSKIKKISDVLPQDSRIKHIGIVNRDNSKKILSEANIFLLPSRGEGCPITLLESISSGSIPIISDAKHGSLDLIEDGKNGFIVKQGSYKGLYNKIIEVINNHDNFKYIYNNSLAYFNNNLSEDHWYKNMTSVIELELSHKHRKKFNACSYLLPTYWLKSMYFFYFLENRLIQFYHFVIFRIIKLNF